MWKGRTINKNIEVTRQKSYNSIIIYNIQKDKDLTIEINHYK